MKLRLAQATDMRDALCKHVYEKLFQALVGKINESTDTTDGGNYHSHHQRARYFRIRGL